MENASRALIIAGATFIAVLILTTMIYLFRAAAKTNENYDEKQAQQQLQLFNSKFEQYNREENTIIDMESLINLAYNTNEENEYDSERNVRIAIKIIDGYYLVIPEVKTSSLNKNEIYRIDDPKKAFRRLKAGYTEANPEYEEINVGQKMNTYRLINSSLGSIGIDNKIIKKKDPNKVSDTFSTSDSDFTDEEFDKWLQIGHAFTFNDMQKSQQLKFIWVLVKLSATGLYESEKLNDIIKDNMSDIEELLNAHLKDIHDFLNKQTGLNRRCKLIIDCNAETRRIIKMAKNIIASHGNVYIVQLENDEF